MHTSAVAHGQGPRDPASNAVGAGNAGRHREVRGRLKNGPRRGAGGEHGLGGTGVARQTPDELDRARPGGGAAVGAGRWETPGGWVENAAPILTSTTKETAGKSPKGTVPGWGPLASGSGSGLWSPSGLWRDRPLSWAPVWCRSGPTGGPWFWLPRPTGTGGGSRARRRRWGCRRGRGRGVRRVIVRRGGIVGQRFLCAVGLGRRRAVRCLAAGDRGRRVRSRGVDAQFGEAQSARREHEPRDDEERPLSSPPVRRGLAVTSAACCLSGAASASYSPSSSYSSTSAAATSRPRPRPAFRAAARPGRRTSSAPAAGMSVLAGASASASASGRASVSSG